MKTKKIFSISILILLLGLSCQKSNCNCENIEKDLAKIDSFYNVHKDFASIQNVYWDNYGEPNFNEVEFEFYRLAVTVVFADYMKIYRMEKTDKKYQLTIKEFAVQTTRYRKDSLMSNYKIPIDKRQWRNLKKVINDNCFWTMYNTEERMFLDGNSWQLEGFDPKRNNCSSSNYHFAFRVVLDQESYSNITQEFIKYDTIDWENIYDLVPKVK